MDCHSCKREESGCRMSEMLNKQKLSNPYQDALIFSLVIFPLVEPYILYSVFLICQLVHFIIGICIVSDFRTKTEVREIAAPGVPSSEITMIG